MFLFQNDLAVANGKAGILKTPLAVVDEANGKLITISELQSGGETTRVFQDTTVPLARKEKLIDSMQTQLTIFHKGYSATLNGEVYDLLTSHSHK